MVQLKEDVLLILVNVLLSFFVAVPIFLIANLFIYIIPDFADSQTSSGFILFYMTFAACLTIGSIIGAIIGELLSRDQALVIALLANAIITVLLLVTNMFVIDIFLICVYVLGVTAGMIGPVFVAFMADQCDRSEGVLSNPFLFYNICCSCFLGSLYCINILRLIDRPLIATIIALCFIIMAIFVLTSRKKYFILHSKTDLFAEIPPLKQLIDLLKLVILIFMILVIINIFEVVVNIWATKNLSHYPSFDQDVMYQKSFDGLFLIPVFIILGIKLYPKLYIVLALFAILIGIFLWPYSSILCMMYESEDISKFSGPEKINLMMVNQCRCTYDVKQDCITDRSINYIIKGYEMNTSKVSCKGGGSNCKMVNKTRSENCISLIHKLPNNTNCNHFINHILENNALEGNLLSQHGKPNADIKCITHKRHVSHYPTVAFIAPLKQKEIIIRLTHIQTKLTIELPPNRITYVIQLLPGKWAIFFQYTINNQNISYITDSEYKRGGFYYQQLLAEYDDGNYLSVVIPPIIFLLPYKCSLNTASFNIMNWMITFGKLMVVPSTLLLAYQSIQIHNKLIPTLACFIGFHLSYIISNLFLFFFTSFYTYIMLVLIILLSLFYYCFIDVDDNQRTDELDGYEDVSKKKSRTATEEHRAKAEEYIPQRPEKPDKPHKPEKPDIPAKPDNPDESDKPKKSPKPRKSVRIEPRASRVKLPKSGKKH